jgi:hypothetical protein
MKKTILCACALMALSLVALTVLAQAGQQKDTKPAQAKDEKALAKDLEGWSHEFGEDKADLTHTGRNRYFILEPGYYLALAKGDTRITITVLNETKMIDGVETRVVEETETKGGQPVESTRDYYVISKKTNSVYYMGEDVKMYKDGKVTGNPGSWHSGVKGARYGLMIPGTPLVKGRYYQEVAPGAGMDRAEILSVTETVVTPAGTFKNCLKTEETTPLEPDSKDYKLYAPGIGQVSDGNLLLVEYGYLKGKK